MNRVEPNRNVYVGHRYVPLLVGEWDKSIQYEGLSIVTFKGASYTSKKMTPPGIDIENEEYWVVTGNYNAQVEHYRDETKRVSEELETKADIEQMNNFKSDVNDEIGNFKTDVNNDISIFKNDITNNIEEKFINILKTDHHIDNTGEIDISENLSKVIEYGKSKGLNKFFVPSGNYYVDNIINIEGFDDFYFEGDGEFIYGDNLNEGGGYYPIFKFKDVKNINLKNLKFKGDGNIFNSNNPCAILFEGDDNHPIIKNINIFNCHFYNWSSFTIRLNSAPYESQFVDRVNVKNVNIMFNTFNNIHTAVLTNQGGVKDMTIKYNTFERLSGNAIKVDTEILPSNGDIPGNFNIEYNNFMDFNPAYREGTQTLQAVITLEERHDNIKIKNNTFDNIVNSLNGVILIQGGNTGTGLENIEIKDNDIKNVYSVFEAIIRIKSDADVELFKNINIENNTIEKCDDNDFVFIDGADPSIVNLKVINNQGGIIKSILNNLDVGIKGFTVNNNNFEKCKNYFVRTKESENIEISYNNVDDCKVFANITNENTNANSFKMIGNTARQNETHTNSLQMVNIDLKGDNMDDVYLIKDNIFGDSMASDSQYGFELSHGNAKCKLINNFIGGNYAYGLIINNHNVQMLFNSIDNSKIASLFTRDNTVFGFGNDLSDQGTYGMTRGTGFKDHPLTGWE